MCCTTFSHSSCLSQDLQYLLLTLTTNFPQTYYNFRSGRIQNQGWLSTDPDCLLLLTACNSLSTTHHIPPFHNLPSRVVRDKIKAGTNIDSLVGDKIQAYVNENKFRSKMRVKRFFSLDFVFFYNKPNHQYHIILRHITNTHTFTSSFTSPPPSHHITTAGRRRVARGRKITTTH
jgi:hypothetical protein